MRFGLVGTGHWARTVHAAGLATADESELAAVWGRDPEKAERVAAPYGATVYRDLDAMLGAVDGVALAVPPQVQAGIAARVARAGRHLLLEKPIATSVRDARELEEAVEQSGVAAVVFFTGRFQPELREWLTTIGRVGGWSGGCARWLGAAYAAGSPYADSLWRREKGGLWDAGPHALAMLTAALGPIVGVTAEGDLAGLSHLILRHSSGATSTAALTLGAPAHATRTDLVVWGDAGDATMPETVTPPAAALGVAADELGADARSATPSHPCGVRLGRHVVELLAAAERQLANRAATGQSAVDEPPSGAR